MNHLPQHTEKPWGSETLWAHTEHYVGKILTVHCGEELSIQYHLRKDETMYVLSGKGMFKVYKLVNNKPELIGARMIERGDVVHVPPKTVHSLEAFEDMEVLEASTNHLDDLVRVRDRYGR